MGVLYSSTSLQRAGVIGSRLSVLGYGRQRDHSLHRHTSLLYSFLLYVQFKVGGDSSVQGQVLGYLRGFIRLLLTFLGRLLRGRRRFLRLNGLYLYGAHLMTLYTHECICRH